MQYAGWVFEHNLFHTAALLGVDWEFEAYNGKAACLELIKCYWGQAQQSASMQNYEYIVFTASLVCVQERLDVSEQMQMMRSSLRAASVVKEVFVEGMPVKRLSLLHSKVNVEGLERVSRNLTGTIYELKLSC